MKKIVFFFIAVFFLSFSSIAQLNKKIWLVGGNGTFSSTNDDYSSTTVASENKRTVIKITPNIGYFIVDKFAIGLKSSLSWTKNKGLTANTTFSTSTTTRFDYGPFIRYYFLDKENPFNLLADLSYQFGNLKFKESNEKGARNNFSVMAGPVLYFNSSVGIEFLLGYKIEKEKLTKSTSTPQYFYTDTKKGMQVSIGLQIHLEKF